MIALVICLVACFVVGVAVGTLLEATKDIMKGN